jgi:hypothetical protein
MRKIRLTYMLPPRERVAIGESRATVNTGMGKSLKSALQSINKQGRYEGVVAVVVA